MISDIKITTNDPEFVKILDESIAIINDTAFVFQLNEKLLKHMKANPGKIKGIHVTQLTIEKDPEMFGKHLRDLINHIVFIDQTCVENLFCICNDDQFFQQIEKAITENSRIISSTGRRFPTECDNSFKQNIVDMTGSLSIDEHVGYWVTVANKVEREIEKLPVGVNPLHVEPYKSSGEYFEPVAESETSTSSSSSSSPAPTRYQKVTIVDTTTFNLKGTYGARCGDFYTGVEIGNKTFSATYRCRPDEHKKTACEVTGEIPQVTKIGPVHIEEGDSNVSNSN